MSVDSLRGPLAFPMLFETNMIEGAQDFDMPPVLPLLDETTPKAQPLGESDGQGELGFVPGAPFGGDFSLELPGFSIASSSASASATPLAEPSVRPVPSLAGASAPQPTLDSKPVQSRKRRRASSPESDEEDWKESSEKLRTLQNKVDRLRKKNSKAKTNQKKLVDSLNLMRKIEVKALQKEIRGLNSQLSTAKGRTAYKTVVIKTGGVEVDALQDEVAQLKAQLSRMKTSHQSEIETFKRQKTADVQTLQTEIVALQSQLATAKGQIVYKSVVIKTGGVEVDALQEEVDRLKSEKSHVVSRHLHDIEVLKLGRAEEVQSFQTEISGLRSQFAATKERTVYKSVVIKLGEKDVLEELTQLKGQAELAEQEKEKASLRNVKLQQKIEILKNQLATEKEENEQLFQNFNTLTDRFLDQQRQHGQLADHMRSQTNQIIEVRTQNPVAKVD